MRRLPETVKRRIVEHLACFHTYAEVARLIAAEFDLPITPRHVRAYDPLSFQFAGSERWLDYHQLVRQGYVNEAGRIAIAHRTFRLARLQGLLDAAFDRGDARIAAAILEQAAKEVGGLFDKGRDMKGR